MHKQLNGYKLVRLRKDGTIGPLFIGRSKILPMNKWMKAENIPTKGFAIRKGWHVLKKPIAPHLSKTGRVWIKVKIKNYKTIKRPENQGGIWYLAQNMFIIERRVDGL